LLLQQPAILRHRERRIADVRAEVEGVIGSMADAAGTQREGCAHAADARPLRP
jgi:hypothetical protein